MPDRANSSSAAVPSRPLDPLAAGVSRHDTITPPSVDTRPLGPRIPSKADDVKLVQELWYLLSPRERIEGFVLLCGMALGAVLEAVGIGLVVPFIAALKDPKLVFDLPVAHRVLSFLHIDQPQQLLIALGFALFATYVLKSGYLLLLYQRLYRYVFDKQASLARRLLTGFLNMPYTFYLQRNSAELIKVTTETIPRFTSGFLIGLMIILGEFLVVLALVALLVAVEPLATVGAVIVLGIPTALVYRAMQHRLAQAGRLTEQSFAAMIQWTEQAIGGIKETLVTGRASFFIDRQAYEVRRLADCMRSLTFLAGIPRLVIDTLAVTAMVAVALVILARGQKLASILPVLGMFGVAAMRLMPSMSRIASGLAQLRFHHGATETLYNELRAVEGPRSAATHPPTARGATAPLRFERSLVLEHVSYHYPATSKPAIDDVSLEIPKGHWVGLIGPTGAGKTTLIDLMLGLFVPTSGRILVDGRDLQDDVAGWQRNIGYIPQHIYLMDDTVRRNVAFGLPDEEIDDERVRRALHDAQIDDLVLSLPGGLSAMTGERGIRLSGGERQRLGIARALYRDPQVLVVDEGTANLDNETEAAIVDTLVQLKRKKTIIVIAHRLSVVKDCDCVYQIQHGRVRNSGALADLFATDPALREFAGSVR